MSQQQNITNLLDPLVSNADASIGKAYQVYLIFLNNVSIYSCIIKRQ